MERGKWNRRDQVEKGWVRRRWQEARTQMAEVEMGDRAGAKGEGAYPPSLCISLFDLGITKFDLYVQFVPLYS